MIIIVIILSKTKFTVTNNNWWVCTLIAMVSQGDLFSHFLRSLGEIASEDNNN